jgi:predicted hotdog family 3-hydroxylacyl-ACP dehydratase
VDAALGAPLDGIACYSEGVSYPSPTAFMPHRPPMLMIDALVSHTDDAFTCTKTFREGDPLVSNGRASALAVIELFAQTAAAHFGYAGLVRGGVMTSGALLGTRRIDLEVGSFAVGEEITIVAKRVMAMAPLAQFDCEAKIDERVIASGSINVAMGGG